MEYFASAAFALEGIAAQELRQMGITPSIQENRVFFSGGEKLLARACIGMRSADRIYRHIVSGRAESFDALFDLTYSAQWQEIISRYGRINVSAACSRSQLMSVPDIQSIVKKGIIKKLQNKYRQNTFDETGEVYSVFASIQNNHAVIALDACGAGLHKRGYRIKNVPAPLRETTAAALLEIIGYKGGPLYDPFCGSGTTAIEGALKAFNIAPGLNRSFESERWMGSNRQVWLDERERAAANKRPIEKGLIIASDISEDMLAAARFHAARAGVAEGIKFLRRQVSEFESSGKGFLITNPPYGKRLADINSARAVYKDMSLSIRPLLNEISLGVITPDGEFERIFGRRAVKKRRIFNGNIQCNYYMYY